MTFGSILFLTFSSNDISLPALARSNEFVLLTQLDQQFRSQVFVH